MNLRNRIIAKASSSGGIIGGAVYLIANYVSEADWDQLLNLSREYLPDGLTAILVALVTGTLAGYHRAQPAPETQPQPEPEKAPQIAPQAPPAVVFANTTSNSGFQLSNTSRKNLAGVHDDLLRLVRLALKYSVVDFGITEGVRDMERQKRLVAEGKSWTYNSRHLHGLAVDVVAYVDKAVTWDLAEYAKINAAFAKASAELDIPYTWGGHWKSRDGVHFELHRDAYPDSVDVPLA